MNRNVLISAGIHFFVLLIAIVVSGFSFRKIHFERTYKVHLVAPSVPEKEIAKPKPKVQPKKKQKKTKPKPKKKKIVKKKKAKKAPPKKKEKSLKEKIQEKLKQEKEPEVNKPKMTFKEPVKTKTTSSVPKVAVTGKQFPFAWYLSTVQDKIKNNWDPPRGMRASSMSVLVAFQILKNGTIQNVYVKRSSGRSDLDASAVAAVRQTTVPPLPGGFQRNILDVSVEFEPTD